MERLVLAGNKMKILTSYDVLLDPKVEAQNFLSCIDWQHLIQFQKFTFSVRNKIWNENNNLKIRVPWDRGQIGIKLETRHVTYKKLATFV